MELQEPYQGLFTTTGHATFTMPPMALHVTWGDAVIIFYADGRLELTGFPSTDAAAVAFWQAVAKWAPGGVQVTLPEGYGSQA